MEEKRNSRKEMMSHLKRLDSQDYKDQSVQIAESLFEQQEWIQAKVIGITISRPPEVDTYKIIKQAWREGKKIAVPKCIPKAKVMDFRYLSDFSQLETVYYGLKEPMVEKTELASPEDIGCLIVPGLAFSVEGFRVGFGGGYYDRFLTGFNGHTVSLAFSCQIIDHLPVEIHDIPVRKVITEQRVIVP
ncbi:5-formyltetrahydrofolate cyclo-ligase [Neobacillus notoginsengisoli]|uniref:5-formyltetrahydrofolate cyclo-ligase n=1 Tax=Neobacillus notoginsengisoli TaxID=1578198 RepID=A0A417YUV1_9BACI|nr:5-formyltetrahydrofolate cyclo-ligase [Neobacillus notoginsengisoli]RHW41060.1 5-formyltetrahydrofolate cyclo-ligase [Neobacillus notoginsengisoli]